jgi:hypothetical protein
VPFASDLEPLAVGAVAGDHDRDATASAGLDQQVDPLRAVEPADGEHEVAVVGRADGSSCGGCGITSALRPVERSSRSATLRDVAKSLRASPSATLSSCWTLRLIARSSGDSPNCPRVGAVELVRLAELVDEPDDLVRVTDDVGGELRRDHEVDPLPVGLFEVEQPPEERLGEHALAGVPLERDADEVGVVAAATELLDEVVGEDLDAAAGKWHLRPTDGDSHVRATIA